MARKTIIVVCDPRDSDQRGDMEAEIGRLLAAHPDARTTWLQSSASYSRDEPSPGTMEDAHVLTCVLEWDEKTGKRGGRR